MVYLDDILLMAEDRETLLEQVHQTITLLEQLGFTVNRSKSIPSDHLLGSAGGHNVNEVALTGGKMQQIMNSCRQILTKGTITAQELAAVIGRMSAARLAVLPAPLHTRHLQHQLIQTQKRSPSLRSKVILSQESLKEVQWWIHHLQEWNGREITRPNPDLIIQSDASLQGWGAVSNGTRTGGPWSGQERTLHINSLELLAGSFAIKAYTKHRNNIHVLLQMDNSTAVAYVNKMGGTRSLSLSLQACHLWNRCLERRILLSAEHLPGVANMVADQESWQVETSSEWKLHRAVFHWTQQILGPCQMDLFATRLNHQLVNYASWRPDPFAQATDAFRRSWKRTKQICIPSLWSGGEVPTKDQTGTEHHYHGSAPVALTGMVSNTDGMPSGLSPHSTQACGPAKKPIQPTPSSDNSRLTKASRLQSIRQQHTATGVSEKASELLLAGWSAGTNAAYQSGWARWNRWCDEQEVDPVSCSI